MMYEQWVSAYGITAEEKVFIFIGMFFFIAAFLFITFILISRFTKNNRQQHEVALRNHFQRSLNAIIIMETTSAVPDSSYRFKIESLKNVMKQSSFARQVMANQLVALKKTISGSSSKILERIYIELDLHSYSIRKLKRGSWKMKAQGIRELTELNYTDAIHSIRNFLTANNKTLREETFLALVRLDQDKPLSFLDHYTGELTPWMRINIHYHLSKSDSRRIPDFSQWFTSSNLDVVLFSLSMARQLRQTSAVTKLPELLSHSDVRVVALTLETITELEAYDLADVVAEKTATFWNNEKISARLVRCLGRISYTHEHKQAILTYLDHPDYNVRFYAAKALYTLDDEARNMLQDFNRGMNGILSGIINHISEPLLQ
jgi:HEAT repeat protein